MIKITRKRLSKAIFVFITALSLHCAAFGAELDDLYGPYLEIGRFLHTAKLDYFQLEEYGTHGGANFYKFNAEPYLLSLDNAVRLSLTRSSELKLRYKDYFPADYHRITYTPDSTESVYQEYNLKYFRELNVAGRFRYGPLEIWAEYLRKKQKSDWNLSNFSAATSYFAYNRAYYNKIDTGLRFLSQPEEEGGRGGLSAIMRPLLKEGQYNLEAGLGYEDGETRRYTDWNVRGNLEYNYFHHLKWHITPKFLFRYGFSDNTELEAGAEYTTPFRYKYIYEMYTRGLNSTFIVGNYRFRNNFRFPFKLTYRHGDNIQVMASSDFSLVNQRLDYWQKSTTDTITNYASRELTCYNLKPVVEVDYLHSAGKENTRDDFSSLTKRMLLANQFLMSLRYKKDITVLSDNKANGDLNLIDTQNIFQYPLDYFVTGTEYANWLVGNYSRYAANVKDQNYHTLEAELKYGVTDNLDVAATAGYRSGSSHDHFTLEDMNSHHYKVRPYYYIDSECDFKVFEDAMLTLKAHVVPDYTVELWRSGDTRGFRMDNTYFTTTVALNVLY